ncbi:MAG: DUF349 domain-containing protein [Mucinivorans sp.]
MENTAALTEEQFEVKGPETTVKELSEPTESHDEPQIAPEVAAVAPAPTAEPIPSEKVDEVASVEKMVEKAVDEFAGKSKQELVDMFAEMIQQRPIAQLRTAVEHLKISFYKIYNAEVEAQKAAHAAAELATEEFKVAEDLTELRLKELLQLYRQKRDSYLSTMEHEKEQNYKQKLVIIDELKELTNSSETLNHTFAHFRELQNRWKETGVVPADKMRDLWDTYNHHVENFYNFIKINKELRDMDLKRNYESKLGFCEQAELLCLEGDPVSAFRKLQGLHDSWRETGPVALEFKEQLWERFKEASARVNKRHQDHFDALKDEQTANLALKEELCIKVEQMATSPLSSRKEWSDCSDEVIEIQKVWKTIGFAPKKDNNRIWERFRFACDKFYGAKRAYFESVKDEFADNQQAKTDLCVQAEALCESEDWKATTDALVELQKQWKLVGVTSRKHSEALWKRFRAACDKFFEAKSKHFETADALYNENLTAKRAILEELKNIDHSTITFDSLKEIQKRWSAIGFVPIKYKDAITKEYKTVVDELFDTLRGSESSRRVEQFKGRAAALRSSGNTGGEREKLYNKVRALEGEIQTLENNIGFFGRGKNAEKLVAGVQTKIDKAKAEIEEIIAKVKLIDKE